MIQQVLIDTYTIALPIVLGYVVYLLKKSNKLREEERKREIVKTEAMYKGIKLLLKIQIIDYHDKYMKQKSIPSYAYDNFVEMYTVYDNLTEKDEKDGMIVRMKEEIDSLCLGGKKYED